MRNERSKAECEKLKPFWEGDFLGLVGEEDFGSYEAGVSSQGEEEDKEEKR